MSIVQSPWISNMSRSRCTEIAEEIMSRIETGEKHGGWIAVSGEESYKLLEAEMRKRTAGIRELGGKGREWPCHVVVLNMKLEWRT